LALSCKIYSICFFMFLITIVNILQYLKEWQTFFFLLFSKLNHTNINYVNKKPHYFSRNKCSCQYFSKMKENELKILVQYL
jgi:hypothetical protein